VVTIKEVLRFAKAKHQGQVDKNSVPYIQHIIRVARKTKSIDERILAILHDVLEDTDTTLEELVNLGVEDKIIEALQLLTYQKGSNYQEYIYNLKKNNLAKAVKLADIADNTEPKRLEKLPIALRERLRKKYELALSILNEV